MTIYDLYEIRTDRIEIKFSQALNVAQFVNTNFVLTNTSLATPAAIVSPFDPIVVRRDYYSTSRTLYLYWNASLPNNSTFTLTIRNQKTVLGVTLPDGVITFSTTTDSTEGTDDLLPSRQPVDVEDYSIKDTAPSTGLFPGSILVSSTDKFGVVSIKPSVSDAAYLDSSYNEGRIEITFSDALAANYISSEYFKMQRKPIGKGIARWADVDALVTSNAELVIIYLPSTDDAPVYGEPAHVYWEDGYKYRLRISAEVGLPIL